jgi:hypothetical protein
VRCRERDRGLPDRAPLLRLQDRSQLLAEVEDGDLQPEVPMRRRKAMLTFTAWMPVAHKHEIKEMAKAAKAKAKGKIYAPAPYVHVKGKLIATMDSGELAKLKTAAGIIEPKITPWSGDGSTWTMTKPGEWTKDTVLSHPACRMREAA